MTDREKFDELVKFVGQVKEALTEGEYLPDDYDGIRWADRRLKALEKVEEMAEDIDVRNIGRTHIDYCDWENYEGTKCVCGMNELRAALDAAKEEG